MTPSFKSPLSKLALAAFAFGSLVATTGAAQAEGEGGHFGGGGHFSGGGGFHGSVHVSGGGGGVRFSGGAHIGTHYARPAFHGGYRGGGWGVHGGFHVGWGYYPRYYYPYSYYYGVPSYYNEGYYPVQPTAAVYAPAAVRPRAELPRFGIGVFGGAINVQDTDGNSKPDSSDMGVLARIRLTPGLILEGAIGKTQMSEQSSSLTTDNRIDRRLGASLIYEFGAYNKFAPYVLAGLGVQQASVDGEYSTTQDFGEVGVGLRYAFSPHFHVTADIRAGSRASVSNDDSMNTLSGTARSIAPPTSTSGDSESYTRGQVAAIVYF